jgi:hypothetical protein
MAETYLNVTQKDLQIQSIWAEDLTGYSSEMFFYKKSDGVGSEIPKTATVTPGASESTVVYTFLAGDTVFDEDTTYVFSFEITKASRSRRCKPITAKISADGVPI